MTTTTAPHEFIVMTANIRGNGGYKRVAVCAVDYGAHPKIISERGKGMVRIVWNYGPCRVGRTKRSAYLQILADAISYAAELQKGSFGEGGSTSPLAHRSTGNLKVAVAPLNGWRRNRHHHDTHTRSLIVAP